MCEINVKTNFDYINIGKHKHEKNMISYDAKSCLKLVLNKLKGMKGPTYIYIPLGT
jgi:hypothetical protein